MAMLLKSQGNLVSSIKNVSSQRILAAKKFSTASPKAIFNKADFEKVNSIKELLKMTDRAFESMEKDLNTDAFASDITKDAFDKKISQIKANYAQAASNTAVEAPKVNKDLSRRETTSNAFDVSKMDKKLLEKKPYVIASKRTEEEDLALVKEKFNFDGVGFRYGYVMYSNFKRDGLLDKIEGEILKVKTIFDNNAEFRHLVNEPFVSPQVRHDGFVKIVSESKDLLDLTKRFLYVISKNRKQMDLFEIFRSLLKIKSKLERDATTLHIVSAEPLEANLRDNIVKVIKEKFNPPGELDIKEDVDPSVEGGYEIFYDGQYHLDKTLATVKKEFQKNLSSAIDKMVTKSQKERDEELRAARLVDSDI